MQIRTEDRQALGFLLAYPRGHWKLAPSCFTPNALCIDQQERGLVELLTTIGNRYIMRLTDAAYDALTAEREDQHNVRRQSTP